MTTTTLRTVAEVTGFSVTTVSRALGGYTDVNETTRRFIISEAERLGYQPNLQARALQQQKTQTIGLIIPTGGMRYSDPFFAAFTAGVGSVATSAGFDLLVSMPTDGQPEMEVYRRMIGGRRVDGLVVMRARSQDERLEYLASVNLPFSVFGRTQSVDNYLYIDVDGVAGQSALTNHLIDLGHQHIAYITPPRNLMFTTYRLQGFRNALEARNLSIEDRLVVEGDLTEANGRLLAHQLLAMTPMPTAIMGGNDSTAIGIMTAVRERSFQVGTDIAVGGYDDIPAAAYLHPGLTTVRQPIFEIGQRLTRMLLDRIVDRDLPVSTHLVAPELLIRGSTQNIAQHAAAKEVSIDTNP